MRFGYGLLTAQQHPDDPRAMAQIYREAVDYGVLAEQAGLDSIWTSEHHFVDDGYMPSQLPVLAAIAARTERIRLGTGVLLAPMFDPAPPRRGRGDGRPALGRAADPRPRERVARRGVRRVRDVDADARRPGSRATIAVLRQAWGEGLTTGDGRPFQYAAPGLNVTPKPVRGAATPIWIGGGAEPAVRRAGRVADGYLGSGASPAALAERVGWIRSGGGVGRARPRVDRDRRAPRDVRLARGRRVVAGRRTPPAT